MLTNFFGKSSPASFIVVSMYFIIGFILWELFHIEDVVGLTYFIEKGMILALCIFMILLLDFIIRKNRLTDINTYSILIFACFLLLVPGLFSERNILLSNFSLLLAFRRILSIQSNKKLFKKILDASLWISLATLFYFWSILWFIPLLISIILKSNKNYRHFLIPITGVGAIFVLASTYYVISDSDFLWFTKTDTTFSLDLLSYKNIHLRLIAIINLVIVTGLTVRWLIEYPKTSKKIRSNYIVLFAVMITGLGIALLSKEKNGSEFLFISVPVSILFTNYLEKINTKWSKEILIGAIVIVPYIILLL